MSYLPGGVAGKLGNRYEAKWVVQQYVRLLREKINSVTLEAVGNENEGVDVCVLANGNIKIAYQCKGRTANDDKWTVSKLNSVINKAKKRLSNDSTTLFRLVSPLPYTLLSDLTQNARTNLDKDPQSHVAFLKEISRENANIIEDLSSALSLNADTPQGKTELLFFLRRFDLQTFSDHQDSFDELKAWLEMLLTGDGGVTFAVLRDIAEEHMGESISLPALLGYISGKGIHTKNLALDNRIAPVISMLQQEFFDSLEPILINGETLNRETTQVVLDKIKTHRIILLKGSAGTGKSGILYEIALDLKKAGINYLPIRLDSRQPENNPRYYGEQLGLPDSPALCLAAIAGGQQSVLIIDQIDALRWTSGTSRTALEVCKHLVNQCREQTTIGNPVSVIIAIRQFDLESDPVLKQWLQGNNDVLVIDVPILKTNEVKAAIGKYYPKVYESLSAQQCDLLRFPHLLQIWLTIAKSSVPILFTSSGTLLSQFFADRVKAAVELGATQSEVLQLLSIIASDMDTNNRIWSPSRLKACRVTTFDRLQSLGLFRESNSKILFAHQSYLDYQIATSVLCSLTQNYTLLDWLGPMNRQTLLKRSQLALTLAFICEENPEQYAIQSTAILQSPQIRFHLKHLTLVTIAQSEPTMAIKTLVIKLLTDDFWCKHLIDTVFKGHTQWIKVIDNDTHLGMWFNSDDSCLKNRVIDILSSVTSLEPTIVLKYIGTGFIRSKEDASFAERILPWSVSENAECYMPLRLCLLKKGNTNQHFDWHQMGETCPLETIRLLQFILTQVETPIGKGWSDELWNLPEQYAHCVGHFATHDFVGLSLAVKLYPSEFWNTTVSVFEKLTAVSETGPSRTDILLSLRHIDEFGLMACICRLLSQAGKSLASSAGAGFFNSTCHLHNSKSPLIERILVESYTELPAECSDDATRWLLADTRRLTISNFQENVSKWGTAVEFVRNHSQFCSSEIFVQLESFICTYKDSEALDDYKSHSAGFRDGRIVNFWGNAQYSFLRALPYNRISGSTIGLLGVLTRHHAIAPYETKSRYTRGYGGTVISPVTKKTEKLSDKAWLGIVSSPKISSDRFANLKKFGEKHFIHTDVETFASDLRNASTADPYRFVALARRFPDDTKGQYIEAVAFATSLASHGQYSSAPAKKDTSWKPATTHDCILFWERYMPVLEKTRTVRDFCRMLGNKTDEKWPDSFYEKLRELATKHVDPSVLDRAGEGPDEVFPHELMSIAINSVRGVATETIANILNSHPNTFPAFKETLANIFVDPHPAVRMAAVNIISSMLQFDKVQAVTLFCELCKVDIRIIDSHISQYFFNVTMPDFYDILSPLVSSALNSPFDEVAEAAASEITARHIFFDCYKDEFSKIMISSRLAHRKGIVTVSIDLSGDKTYFEKSVTILKAFQNDPEEEISKRASAWISPETLSYENAPKLAEQFLENSFLKQENLLLHYLKECVASILPFKGVIMRIVKHVVSFLGDASSKREWWRFNDLPILILRLYEEAQSQNDTQCISDCLDAWDALYEAGFNNIQLLSDRLNN